MEYTRKSHRVALRLLSEYADFVLIVFSGFHNKPSWELQCELFNFGSLIHWLIRVIVVKSILISQQEWQEIQWIYVVTWLMWGIRYSAVAVFLGSKVSCNYWELWRSHYCKSDLDLTFSEPNHKQRGNLLLLNSLYFSTQLYTASIIWCFITVLFCTCVLWISTTVISAV